jgi:hypothetical protein
MPKPEIEFTDSQSGFPWRPVPGDTLGLEEKILSLEPETGDHTRLLRFPQGFEGKETVVHDFWEEVWVVEGTLHDVAKNVTASPGHYACRPPGMKHGPYRSPGGCITFELRYYKP